jgi:DNA repair exonuclease SbcCD ATPase subunit
LDFFGHYDIQVLGRILSSSLSLEKINKRLSQLESTQKQDIQKLEKQIARLKQLAEADRIRRANRRIDDLRAQLNQLQQAMGNYQTLDQSLAALSGRFDSMEKQLAEVRSAPNPTSSSMIPPDLVLN